MDKTKRNALLAMLADLNELIEDLESDKRRKEEVTDINYQLLQAYNLKLDILKTI